ncbi:MAG: TrkA C-terminal domain-containing protein [Nannocystaceae bacterium]
MVAREFLGRLMIQSIRQPGLARVYGELLSFVGDEFCTRGAGHLVGRRFGEACLAFEAVIVCGLARAGEFGVLLSPPDDAPLREGDRLLVLAQDADVPLTVAPHTADATLPASELPPPAAQRLQVVGYRPDLPAMLQEIDTGYPAGGEVAVLGALAPDEARARAREAPWTASQRAGHEDVQERHDPARDARARDHAAVRRAVPWSATPSSPVTPRRSTPCRTSMSGAAALRGLQASRAFRTVRLVSRSAIRGPRSSRASPPWATSSSATNSSAS